MKKLISAIVIVLASSKAFAESNYSLQVALLQDKSPDEYYTAWVKAGAKYGFPKASATNDSIGLEKIDDNWLRSSASDWNILPGDKKLFISGFYANELATSGATKSKAKFQLVSSGIHQCMNTTWLIMRQVSSNMNLKITDSIHDWASICINSRIAP